MKKNLLLVFFVLFLYGCGGGATSSSSFTSPIETNTTSETISAYGYLVDSAIEGVQYRCGNDISGLTDAQGKFQYKSDCIVEFFIGDGSSRIVLGEINGSKLSPELKIFPANIVDPSIRTTDTSNIKVINFARFLQSLDEDNNSSNGILISEGTRQIIDNIKFESDLDLRKNTLLESELSSVLTKIFPTRTLKASSASISELNATLISHGYTPNSSKPKTPYTVNEINNALPYTFTKSPNSNLNKKTLYLKGEPGNSIMLALNSTNTVPLDSNFSNLDNLKIGSDGLQKITLYFNDPSITVYHYFIKTKDSNGIFSDEFNITVTNDTIPPHVESSNLIEEVLEEQLLFRNIHATDANGIKNYRIVTATEDNRSTDYSIFTIDSNGTVTFKELPNFDLNINAVFNVVVRAVDLVNNMTDLLLQVRLKNLLDNPPTLTSKDYNTTIMEGLANGAFIFNASTMLETNLTIAPDNDPILSPIYYQLHNYTNLFDINATTGVLTIKDNTDSLFDYEQLPNSIDLNISVENNNTKQSRNGDLNVTYATLTINILNKIDTAPSLKTPTGFRSIPEKSNDYGNYSITIDLDTNNSDFNTSGTIYNITNGDNNHNFYMRTLPDGSGSIEVNTSNSLDYETTKEYNLTIQATNTWDDNTTHSSNSVVQNIKILNAVDIAPVIGLKDLNSSISENTTQNTTVAILGTSSSIIDVNQTIHDENNVSTYKIISILRNDTNITNSSETNYPFTIDNNGVITVKPINLADNSIPYYIENIDANDTIYKISVQATNYYWDNNSSNVHLAISNPVDLNISITNIIDNKPVLKSFSNTIAIDENVTKGTYIDTATTNGTVYDENNVTTYYFINDTSNGKFDINATTGVITVHYDNNETNKLDWETTAPSHIYTLGIQATNGFGNSTSETLYVEIKNIIEKVPSFTAPTTINIHENIDVGSIIGFIDINGTELDTQTITTFGISGDGGKFELSPLKTDSNTTLKYVEILTKNTFDYETNSSYTLEVNATNTFGTTSSFPINIKILDDIEKNIPLLIVGINFTDQNLTTFNNNTVDNYLENLVFGSLSSELQDYFKKISRDKFYFKKANIENETLKNGVLIVDINQTYNNSIGTESKIQSMINLAMNQVNSKFDFNSSIGGTNIDLNSDGNITKNEFMFLFVVPGNTIISSGANTEAATNFALNDSSVYSFDLKTITFGDTNNTARYVIVPENDGNTTIGVIAKYISNALFDFPYASSNYVFDWYDLMGNGYKGADQNKITGQTPVHLSAANKISQGWIYPKTLRSKSITDTSFKFYNTYDKTNFNVIKIPTTTSNKYYLLENRNQITDTTLNNSTQYYDNGFYNKNSSEFYGGIVIWEVIDGTSIKFIKLVNKSNDTESLPTEVKNAFEFYYIGSIDSVTKSYDIGIQTK